MITHFNSLLVSARLLTARRSAAIIRCALFAGANGAQHFYDVMAINLDRLQSYDTEPLQQMDRQTADAIRFERAERQRKIEERKQKKMRKRKRKMRRTSSDE